MSVRNRWLAFFLAVIVLPIGGCATGTAGPKPGKRSGHPQSRGSSVYPAPVQAAISYAAEGELLGNAIRSIGAAHEAGFVLLAGLESQPTGPVSFSGTAAEAVAAQLSQSTGNVFTSTPFYQFIYPSDYAVLLESSFEGALPARYRALEASVDFGAGTEIYNVFALLNKTFGINLVADNAIADAVTGEIALHHTPLELILDAVFRSARIPGASYTIDANDTYIFIGKAGVDHSRELLLNRGALSGSDRALLERRVNVEMPEPALGAEGVVFRHSAEPLRKAIPYLSEQIGMPVTARRPLGELPVNFFTLTDVPVSTALDLLIRQWQVPRFHYRVSNGAVELLLRDER
ncbi:MAG: hypothetical protein HYV27_24500 [Candidatus Hydrogenedentes bacterium]|nr:hypothetical protein [Candidatus Hydrogenedentota bacterium]